MTFVIKSEVLLNKLNSQILLIKATVQMGKLCSLRFNLIFVQQNVTYLLVNSDYDVGCGSFSLGLVIFVTFERTFGMSFRYSRIYSMTFISNYGRCGCLRQCAKTNTVSRVCEAAVNKCELTIGRCHSARRRQIIVDFSKAFDQVSNRHLIHKLKLYGINEIVTNCINAFLSSRTQRVILDGTTSDQIQVTSGVPQGSVLGPLLFLL